MRSKKKKEQVDSQDKQRRSELEERQFGKTDRKDLDKVVICREDRRIISVVRRREAIRRAVLEEKACVEREWGRSWEETTDTTEQQQQREQKTEWRRGAGGRRAGKGELTWRDGTESDSRPHLLPQMEQ